MCFYNFYGQCSYMDCLYYEHSCSEECIMFEGTEESFKEAIPESFTLKDIENLEFVAEYIKSNYQVKPLDTSNHRLY